MKPAEAALSFDKAQLGRRILGMFWSSPRFSAETRSDGVLPSAERFSLALLFGVQIPLRAAAQISTPCPEFRLFPSS